MIIRGNKWKPTFRTRKKGGSPLYLAGTTRLELAATGVTDRHANQLHHVPATCFWYPG